MSSLNAIPLSYETPPFPSLYWPFNSAPGEPKYLINLTDIWKFTLYWTLITIPLAHLVVALWAIFMQFLAATERAKFLKDHNNFEKNKKNKGTGTSENESDDEEYESAREEEEEEEEQQSEHRSSEGEKLNGTTQQQQQRQRQQRRRRRKEQNMLSAKNRKLMGASPFKDFSQYSVLILAIYIIIGSIEAFIAGSLVGVVLGAVYTAGYFRMSVWTPLFWGIINMLVLILSSFRISGGM